MKKGNLIIISGPAGIGKGTVCKELTAEHPDIRLSVSWTTRDIRPGEIADVTYHYHSEYEFQKMVSEGGFLEYAGKFGNHYGTPRAFVEDCIAKGENVILEIETQGAREVMEQQQENVISIFLLPPTMATLKQRLVDRKREEEPKLLKRFEEAYHEIEAAKEYDHYIVNADLENTKQTILDIIDGKPVANVGNLDDILKALQEEIVL